MAFVRNINPLVTHFQDRIDWLIDSAGKSIVLYFKKDPQTTEPDSDDYDLIRGGIKKPFFKDSPYIEEYDTTTIKALISQNPRDFKNFGIRINDIEGTIRLKTYLSDVPSLIRCNYIKLGDDVQNIIGTKFKIIREPIPIGLKTDRYAISFWERII